MNVHNLVDNELLFAHDAPGALLITPCALDPTPPSGRPRRRSWGGTRDFLSEGIERIMHLRRRHLRGR